VIQAVVGYAWLVSAIDKIRSETFLPGLPDELAEMSRRRSTAGTAAFWKIQSVPNADLFGRLVTWGELLVGIGLIVMAVFLVLRGTNDRWALWRRPSRPWRCWRAFHERQFSPGRGFDHPFVGYSDGLEGSVDLDFLMPLVQLVLLGVNPSIAWLGIRQLRKATPREVTASVRPAGPQRLWRRAWRGP
jgi:hypothetical protein